MENHILSVSLVWGGGGGGGLQPHLPQPMIKTNSVRRLPDQNQAIKLQHIQTLWQCFVT